MRSTCPAAPRCGDRATAGLRAALRLQVGVCDRLGWSTLTVTGPQVTRDARGREWFTYRAEVGTAEHAHPDEAPSADRHGQETDRARPGTLARWRGPVAEPLRRGCHLLGGDGTPLLLDVGDHLISENKDTAIHFPPLSGGVSVEGVGRGGTTVARFDWITAAPRVVYWGDMDADGLEILDGFRAAGVPAASILMDPAAYDAWERFGTNVDQHGKPLGPRPARPVLHLTDPERTLYCQLIAPDWRRHRRVEQERIPLDVALARVHSAR